MLQCDAEAFVVSLLEDANRSAIRAGVTAVPRFIYTNTTPSSTITVLTVSSSCHHCAITVPPRHMCTGRDTVQSDDILYASCISTQPELADLIAKEEETIQKSIGAPKRPFLDIAEIQSAVQTVMQGELAKHAISEAVKATTSKCGMAVPPHRASVL